MGLVLGVSGFVLFFCLYFVLTYCYMQMFLRGVSVAPSGWGRDCACLSVHTAPTFAKKNVQDTQAFHNQLLTTGVPLCALEVVQGSREMCSHKDMQGLSGGRHF